MKNFFTTSLLAMLLVGVFSSHAFAAKIIIDTPVETLSRRQPIMVTVSLDTEGAKVSGISGNFSFPADLFTVDSVILESSIVSPWVEQPKISEEKYLDNRTHITFEGIFPGGYDGVRSPYFEGIKQGKLFSIILIPKSKGSGLFIVDDITLHEYGPDAKLMQTESAVSSITVPDAIGAPITPYPDTKQIQSKSLTAFVTRDELVARNAWYIVVNDKEARSTIEAIYVAETDDISPLNVSDSAWRKVSSPYVLLYQNRSKHIHIHVVYSNKTYSYITLQPVENFTSISFASRILISIVVLLALLHHYRGTIKLFIRKKN